ncbi:hypothetical protein PCASD_17895 [Puccinia coronata f. sp. avenae]|uniref:Uncharacterized protein n=1 Tax=Puccinia coronata f. sp. avenae TaxID=200324 RepID=A0A2N5U934_9BASI|nr:hypothetical protein PCASD_17895 [Puccinia coronata f. sp. avenae]
MESIQPLVPAQPPELCRSISAFSRQPEPVDDPRVSNWASDVRMATSDNNQSASANRDINQATIGSPSIEALASALNLFAQGSLQIGSASHNTMKIIAENLISLNSAIANLSLDNVVNMQSSPSLRAPATRGSGRQRSQATYDNNMDVDTPAIRPRGSRNVEIQSYVRQHCATMFGRCARDDSFPPPATAEERRAWITRGGRDTPSDNSEDDSVSIAGSAMDLDDDYDPGFPYPNGPGHSAASPEALKIIWRAMRKAGVKSFRPDLSKAMNHPVNRFLWDLARDTFTRVVNCGEYDPLTIEILDQVDLKQYFVTHVQGYIMRKYQENKHFTPEQLSARQKKRRKTTRHATLKRWRLETVVSQPTLVGLIPIIEHCCSDDETDDEADPSLLRPGAPMRASVLKLPWRSQQVERIMIALDRMKARRRDFATRKPNTPRHECDDAPSTPKSVVCLIRKAFRLLFTMNPGSIHYQPTAYKH